MKIAECSVRNSESQEYWVDLIPIGKRRKVPKKMPILMYNNYYNNYNNYNCRNNYNNNNYYNYSNYNYNYSLY